MSSAAFSYFRSFGHTIKVKKGIMPVFVLGASKISNVPTGFFAGAIGAQKMSVIGSEILKQFNIIFDIANNDLYIEPRHAQKYPSHPHSKGSAVH